MSISSITDFLIQHQPCRITEQGVTEAAVAVVLATEASASPELLLVKRSEREGDPWSGQMALPGGRREPQDQDLLKTARRETREETGVSLTEQQLLGELDDLHPRTRVLPAIIVRPFVFSVGRRPLVAISDEVTLHLWVSLHELRASSTRSLVRVRGEELEVPSYVIGPHIVWGMTERILRPIINLAG